MTPEHPPLAADAVTVGADDELAKALRRATPNRQILIRAGTRLDDNHEIGVEGVLVRAERPLEATVTGEWLTTASNVMLHGLRSRGGKVVAGGFDGVVRRCDFSGWRGQAVMPVNGYGSYPKGGRLRLDYCTFHEPAPWSDAERKSKSEPSRVAIRSRSNKPATFHYGATLEHLRFYLLPEKCGPGYYGQTDAIEPIPDGPSHPNVDAGWRIRWILIESHRGKDALVDLKGGGFTVEDMTILGSGSGRLDVRMGSGNTLRRIYLGDGAGMDLSGSRHLVEDVYLDGGAIKLIGGSTRDDEWKRPGGNGLLYQQPCDVTLRRVGGKGKVVVGHKYPASKLPALRTRAEACAVPVERGMESGTVVAGDAPPVVVRKLTTAECGVTAAWPMEPEPEQPAGEWVITWPGSKTVWLFKHNYDGLPDFTILPKLAARFPSEASARACIDGPDRPAVADPTRLGVAPCPV